MKKFDIFNQVHATFDRFGFIAGFRYVATVSACTPEHALAIAKEKFPLVLLPMVDVHCEPSSVGTKRVWR